MKEAVGVVCVILAFVGYGPYLLDTIRGKTKPHVYSWFIWGLLGAIAGGLQISYGGGLGSLATLAGAFVCLVILGLGLRGGDHDITKLDSLFFALSMIALFLWLVMKQPILSIILVSVVDILGFLPTVRKSWSKPHSETLFTYSLGAARYSLSLLALQKLTFVTLLFHVTWIAADTLFSFLLVIRRKSVVTSWF